MWLLIGAILGGLAVGCGAFGAHVLKSRFVVDGILSPTSEQALANWETAARYQMYHALALLAVGCLAAQRPGPVIHLAGWAMTVGTFFFSGCLYALVLTSQRWLGAVAPVGGSLLIVGWIFLAIAVCLAPASPSPG
jgi:uncharacterized membrane protein YgdD (TMEM256/DUF423 family)